MTLCIGMQVANELIELAALCGGRGVHLQLLAGTAFWEMHVIGRLRKR